MILDSYRCDIQGTPTVDIPSLGFFHYSACVADTSRDVAKVQRGQSVRYQYFSTPVVTCREGDVSQTALEENCTPADSFVPSSVCWQRNAQNSACVFPTCTHLWQHISV